jgi:hypothetical protein
MVSYPIYIARDGYRGNDPKKRQRTQHHNQKVAELERLINEMLKKQTREVQTYLWMDIATETGMDYNFIKDVGYSIDGGSGGFTAALPTYKG